jgi:GMP synthase-like glutamine amidotransferase
VLQHISCEPPGLFGDLLAGRGFGLKTAELDDGDPLPPEPETGDVVLVMGGPMGAYEEPAHPWLAAEKRWIAGTVAAGVPVLGVCLGAQLLAASLGAPVGPGERPEVGVLPVRLTPAGRADPVLGGLGDSFAALQWHGDTFGIPDGGVLLAGSDAYPHQAFRAGAAAYGVQFHVEVTEPMLRDWQHVPAYQASATAVLGPDGFRLLAGEFAQHQAAMTRSAERLLTGWLAQAGLCAPPLAGAGRPAAVEDR